jgi:hypothetical protein
MVNDTNELGGNMLPEFQKSTYDAFYDSTEKNNIFNAKMTIVIQLAASLAIGCYP